MGRSVDDRTKEALSWYSFAARLDQIACAAAVVTLGIWTYDYFSENNLIELDLAALVATLLLGAGMIASYRKSTLIED